MKYYYQKERKHNPYIIIPPSFDWDVKFFAETEKFR